MSTLKVNKIENTATANGGISIDNTGHVQVDGLQMPTTGPLSNRNLIINGAMQVAQRATSVTGVAAGGYHTIDRFRCSGRDAGFGTVSLDQSTDVPASQGFTSSYKVKCTTSPGNPYPNADAAWIDQRIEAQNLQHLKYGTANAEDVTLSFWAKASEGGTYCVALHQEDPDKTYVKEYTLVSGEWKYVSLTFPGNTADVIDNDNDIGFIVGWMLSAGSDNHMTANAWATPPSTGGLQGTANQNQLFDTANAEFYLTAAQLEVGSKATPFEHESRGQTLAKCKRYFQYIHQSKYVPYVFRGTNGNAGATGDYPLPVAMRTGGSSNVVVISSIRNFTGFNSAGGSSEAGSFAVAAGVYNGTDAEWYKFSVYDISNLANNELQCLSNYTTATNYSLDAEL